MELLGGQYPADQNPDGTWNIRGLPIFGENRRTFGSDEFVVDREWLLDAVKFADASAAKGYFAPLHVRHHANSPHAPNQAEHVGFVRPTHVGSMEYDGESIAVLFADYLAVPNEAFERFKRRQMPYVSVEAPMDERRISSAAILTDEEPFFRMPMQTIGAETPYALPTLLVDETPVSAGTPLVAAFNAPKGASFLSRFNGGTPVQYVTKDDLEKFEANLIEKIGANVSETLAKFAAKPDDEETPDTDEESEDEEHVSEPGDDGVVDGPPDAAAINDAQFSDDAVKLQARLDALEGKVSKREQEDAIKARYSAAAEALAGDGYHLTENAHTSLRKFAAYGAQQLDDYVASFRENVLPDPPSDLAGLTNGGRGRGAPDSDAVATFAAGDPDKLAFARTASAEYAQFGGALKSTEAQFIESRYRQHGAA